jgi:hypothetical protein
MPIATSEKTELTPDGQTPSDDSADSIPTEKEAVAVATISKVLAQDADKNLAPNWAALTEGEQGEVRQSMEWMGVSIRRARKILRAYGGGRYLRRGIGAALALSFEFSSLEEGERALRWCRKMYKNRDLPLKERVEILKAMAPIMESLRRLGESSLAIADKFDVQEKEKPKGESSTLQVGVSINNFPPVAQVPPRANGGVLTDANGAESRDRDL